MNYEINIQSQLGKGDILQIERLSELQNSVDVIFVGKIETEGKAEPKVMALNCAVCDSPSIYSRGDYAWLHDKKIYIAADIAAYRCSDSNCACTPLLNADVYKELVEKVREADPIRITAEKILRNDFSVSENE
jgi:hypothetical protein